MRGSMKHKVRHIQDMQVPVWEGVETNPSEWELILDDGRRLHVTYRRDTFNMSFIPTVKKYTEDGTSMNSGLEVPMWTRTNVIGQKDACEMSINLMLDMVDGGFYELEEAQEKWEKLQ